MSVPSPEFVALVKSAVESLHDGISLRSHPLADILCGHLSTGDGRAQALRRALLNAIDSLRTTPLYPPADSRRQRIHQVLALRYVEALSYQDVMARLCLSQPQYHRYQHQAVGSLAMVLWENAAGPDVDAIRPLGRLVAEYAEPDHLSRGNDVFDLKATVVQALETMRPVLAGDVDAILASLTAESVVMAGNQVVARQLIIILIGYTLTVAPARRIRLVLRAEDVCVTLIVVSQGEIAPEAPESASARRMLALARQLAELLSGMLTVHLTPGVVTLALTLPPQPRTLLVIDDNPRLVPLLQRVVADHGYRVCAALDVPSGLALARAIRPSVVLLDIVMPGQDGWDALSALKGDPATRNIPVIVCSILAEPLVALSLGADGFLEKPLDPEELFKMLARLPLERATVSPIPPG